MLAEIWRVHVATSSQMYMKTRDAEGLKEATNGHRTDPVPPLLSSQLVDMGGSQREAKRSTTAGS
ncbi:hypothetical protein Mapa_003461 [Marchantia paleacea]|nr:hypothetical protein Mapa_003461 [Marchantia paleacea]